jgi:hypothetical protein
MTYSLRWQRLLLVVGLLTVSIGWTGYAVLLWHVGSPSGGEDNENMIFGVASVVGYAVLAAASWSWFERSNAFMAGMTRVLRLFALGNLCLAAGLGAICYFWSNLAVTEPYDGRTTPLGAASYGCEAFGFLLAAIAFWSAASEVRAVRAVLPSSDGELVSAPS